MSHKRIHHTKGTVKEDRVIEECFQTFQILQELTNHQQTHPKDELDQTGVDQVCSLICDMQGCTFKKDQLEILKT